ncbi:hypothetical protein KKKH46_04800 [Helicobacter pylori]
MLGFIGGGVNGKPNPEELAGLALQNYYKQDFTQAKKYFEKSCDLNFGMACGALGNLYGDGQGVEKNLTKAAYFYSKACELKESFGCGALAVLYINGQGVEKDLTKAAQYISKACKLGDQKACEALKEK